MSEILIRNMARVELPEDLRETVLKMYIYRNRDGDSIRTYRYSKGIAYLPPNLDKLKIVSSLTGYPITDMRNVGAANSSTLKHNPDFYFREYQHQPVADLTKLIKKEKYGILNAGCGCGKTIVMTAVAGTLGTKILILVDMGSLLSQWQEAFQMVWNSDVQILSRDTAEFSDVCITTFQLLHYNPDLVSRISKEFGCLLLDEFHTTASETRREILTKMNNMYRIGCTATLRKKGYSDEVLTDFVSNSVVNMVDPNALRPVVQFVETGVRIASNDPDNWSKTTSALGSNLYRNKLISDIAIEQVLDGRRLLIIGTTIVSLKQILIHLNKCKECKPKLYIGSTSLKQDQELKNQLASGDINTILTVKKADKGLDLPSLDCLILTKPSNNRSFIEQVAGRIVRKMEGKNTPLILDMLDKGDLVDCFAGNREKWYLGLNYDIVKKEIEDEMDF